jgi:DNA replication and repair protein RecF
LQLRPQAGINVLTGPNGAGKTSILEGIYLLSHAGSFRTARSEVL